jgi:hypothetical protein
VLSKMRTSVIVNALISLVTWSCNHKMSLKVVLLFFKTLSQAAFSNLEQKRSRHGAYQFKIVQASKLPDCAYLNSIGI